MEEKRNEELEQISEEMTSVQQSEEVKTEEEEEKVQEQQGLPNRSIVLRLLAGVYLLYTGYRLCENVLSGAEGASWGFFVAGVAFLLIGAVMLFISGKNAMKKSRERKAAEERERELNPQLESEEVPKSMSIAERARLAGNVADKEAQEAEVSNTEDVQEENGSEE